MKCSIFYGVDLYDIYILHHISRWCGALWHIGNTLAWALLRKLGATGYGQRCCSSFAPCGFQRRSFAYWLSSGAAVGWNADHLFHGIHVFLHLLVDEAKHQDLFVLAQLPDSLSQLLLEHVLVIDVEAISVSSAFVDPVLLGTYLGRHGQYFSIDWNVFVVLFW